MRPDLLYLQTYTYVDRPLKATEIISEIYIIYNLCFNSCTRSLN